MDILSKNLEEIKELKKIYNENKVELYETENTKIDIPTLKINNIYLHSKYDPVTEADKITELLLKDKDDLDVILLFGGGLGYIQRLLFEKVIKNSNLKILPYIIYLEADIKIFLTSLKCFDWTEILKNENFKIFLEADNEQIGTFIQSIPTKRIRYYYHRPSFMLYENYYKNIQKYISYILDRKDMNNATFARFQKVWTRNIIFNLSNYINSNNLNSLKDTAKGMTAILAAGGPNLEKTIGFIKKNKDFAVIISVDTAYKYLLKNGITPDILVTIDPQFWNYKYLENIKINNTIIVTDSSVYYKVLQIADADNYFIGSSIFPIIGYFDAKSAARGTLAAGGSVATTAFDTARIIGSSEIILTGLDLSYPNRMTHFKGAFFETRFLTLSDYFKTAEFMSY
ncbi:MAG: motility associated factor glycosyltransferase family protein, partial [Spirochaetes bacterium]|nr:motility associated factor glycosyltransferase family protein [Spirochaetota bacterium]